ncbi:HNH endonuclease domain-containing protein [Clostridium sp. MD294]|uniref:HNH endonuclease domain-containing protein n=1 Tax=Clostridium sp. MD294 TaxID=97138 RepID=UPI0002CA41BD|nr:HNH endonuclease domain-containing protein [Clostridium sp. MD294]NDO45761.1 HNH endonuclease [Clostridium sp. MD294]USF30585.1 hypothetical protein C820_002027 [Clostridium sp. MD294]
MEKEYTIEEFKQTNPCISSYWRSINLFGKNVASYKFALALSLIELMLEKRSSVTLEELAVPFSRNICQHLKTAPKQCTSRSSQFLDTCNAFNNNEISYEQLLHTTVKKGFNHVIDAFHIVNNDTLPIQFYQKDYSAKTKKIILTDEIFKLADEKFYNNLVQEVQARWKLVETAWELNVSRNLLNVNYNEENNIFYIDNKLKRKNITSARAALNGYQKGKCFYCFDDITIDTKNKEVCDVDHFFPYALQKYIPNINLNGVWNLVLSCTNCNRGLQGKFAKVPVKEYLQRLYKRNEYLISSHHPLRETLITQMGNTVEKRALFLKEMDKIAIDYLIHRWQTQSKGKKIF